MIPESPNAYYAWGFQPLASLLASHQPGKLVEAQRRVAEFNRDELLVRFQRAFSDNRRPTAFLMADGLIAMNIPPSSWLLHPCTPAIALDVNRRFDLMLYDLRWLRRWHNGHPEHIRYGRYRELFTAYEPAFHRAAEFVFYAGKRPIWKIVGSLSMTKTQQWDCVLLRSAPINKRQAATDAARDHIHAAIQASLVGAGRTLRFTDADAEIALARRHTLWLCSRMADSKSPTQIAARYEQMTGQSLTRQIAARQLGMVNKALLIST